MRIGTRWFAVSTLPQKEQLAATHLVDQSFRVFLPRQERLVRHARKMLVRSSALFPGYLFVACDPEISRWRSINGTRGVRAILSDGDRPLALPHGVVEGLMALTDPDGLLLVPELRRGDRVRVFEGPFADLLGTVEELSGAERIRVLIEIAHGAVPVSLPRRMVVRAA